MSVQQQNRSQATANAMAEYERRKRAWLLANPGAAPDEIEAACRRIAALLGI